MWHEGSIMIPVGKKETVICRYWVKAYDEPSGYGINEGKISKLTIQINGKITAEYDRGWEIEPDENDTPTQIAYCILLHDYN